MASYLPLLPRGLKIYLDLDILYPRYYRSMLSFSKGSRKLLYRLEKERMRKFEEEVIKAASRCYIASEVDRANLPGESKDKVSILPNVIDAKGYTFLPPSRRTGGKILFTGRFSYAPNIDGATFFRGEIFPEVKRHVTKATFWIVGANPSKSIKKLHDGRDIFVTGFVEDMKGYLQDAKVFVCPLRFGGGTRLKILEAMAAGLPVVSTSAGCEGLDVKNGVHLFIEDSPLSFARRVAEILKGEGTHDDMCRHARLFVEQRYSKESLKIEGLTGPCER